MSQEKMDFAKVLAVLAQPQETPPPLENVERKRLKIPYIKKDGQVEQRIVHVVMPQGAARPMPLIYVPHYEMGEDAVELRAYLAKGWAVACPGEFMDNYNGQLTDNDLVFNNAALYTLRQLPEFDRERIALVGGSAGGYTALMLTGLQLGICTTLANGPIANAYFNFDYHFQRAQALNMAALAELAAKKEARESEKKEAREPGENAAQEPEKKEPGENAALEFMQSLAKLPIPFIAGLAGLFAPIRDNFPEKEGAKRWEALSAVGLADCFCNPVMVNHCTSDILVPVDQISRRFTYAKPGDSLPEDFDIRLPKDFPGKLGCSLEECLPERETRVERIPVPEHAPESVLPYDPEKRFNLNIFDDGPAEGYGSHSSRMDGGRRDDIPYLEEMLKRTAARTNILTPAMLKSLLERYQGNSVALPAHTGVDDTAYGSLAVYQKEVCQELLDWKQDHGAAALEEVFEAVLLEEPEENRGRLREVMEEISQCV